MDDAVGVLYRPLTEIHQAALEHSIEELVEAERAIKVLGGKLEETSEFILPVTEKDENNSGRLLIKIGKIKPTDSKYPRGGGKPFKSPLYIDKSSK